MKTIATICARGGSIGLPGKNIKNLCGKPLIVHTIKQALACNLIHDVYVSTDSQEIADIAQQHGAKVPFIRPGYLATDTSGKSEVLQHCVDFLINQGQNISKIVDLQPTSPLRIVEDIENCLSLLSSNVDVVFSTCLTDKNPYFCLVEENMKEEGYVHISKVHSHQVVRRQDAPKVYALNGAIYVWHLHTLKKGLWGGKSKHYIMPKERSVDIDDEIDFELAELILKKAIIK